jgi:hypothetical protein
VTARRCRSDRRPSRTRCWTRWSTTATCGIHTELALRAASSTWSTGAVVTTPTRRFGPTRS